MTRDKEQTKQELNEEEKENKSEAKTRNETEQKQDNPRQDKKTRQNSTRKHKVTRGTTHWPLNKLQLPGQHDPAAATFPLSLLPYVHVSWMGAQSQHRTRQGNHQTRQDKINETKHNTAKQNKTRWDKTKQN